MFGLHIDVSILILYKLTLTDTINILRLNKEFHNLNQANWIWEARMITDYPHYINHPHLPIGDAVNQYNYIVNHQGEIFILVSNNKRCYYDNISQAYAKFMTEVIYRCKIEEYNLNDLPLYRVPRNNGFISLYLDNQSSSTKLLFITDTDARILYPEFLHLPNTLSAPYYSYQWITTYDGINIYSTESTIPIFDFRPYKDGSSSYYRTNSEIFKGNYPDF